MCYHTSTADEEKLREFLHEYDIVNYAFYYHVSGFEHKYLPVTIHTEPRKIQPAIWGLVPGNIQTSQQAKEIADMTLNAKAETVFERPAYKNYIGQNRCLIWVDGFYEWQWRDKGKNKVPHYIYMPNHIPFSLGGVFSNWVRPDTGEVMLTCSIITTESNGLLSEIHNNKKRMPLIIAPDKRDHWLGKLTKGEIADMMQPYPDGELQAHPVSKLLSRFNQGVDTNIPEIQQAEQTDTLW
jgi:putative SOS response-associated peptidase YedK